jgi:protein-S-isoprenylcysteine O-methyltransferase Ste14
MTLRERHVIDLFKISTGPFVLACMAAFHRWSLMSAWLYLALHGTYGLLWVAKSRLFPDAHWEHPLTVGSGALLSLGLASYWVARLLLAADDTPVSPPLAALCVALFGVGVFLHFASDMQKHVSLALRPGQLITSGLSSCVRNPHYLGELFIYLSFAALAQHAAPFAVLAVAFVGQWLPNMLSTDWSLARYPDFAAYRARSGLIVPRVLTARVRGPRRGATARPRESD